MKVYGIVIEMSYTSSMCIFGNSSQNGEYLHKIFKVNNELDLFNQLNKFKGNNCIHSDMIKEIHLLAK
mgnify:FL=1